MFKVIKASTDRTYNYDKKSPNKQLGQQLLTKYEELHRTVFNHLYFRAGPDIEPKVNDSRASLLCFLGAVIFAHLDTRRPAAHAHNDF